MDKKIQLVEGYFLQVAFIELAEKHFNLGNLRKIRTILKYAIEEPSSEHHKFIVNNMKKRGYSLLSIKRAFKELNNRLGEHFIEHTLRYFCNELYQSVENDHMRYKLVRTKSDKKKLDMDID